MHYLTSLKVSNEMSNQVFHLKGVLNEKFITSCGAVEVLQEQWTIAMNVTFILFAQFELLIYKSLMKVIIE